MLRPPASDVGRKPVTPCHARGTATPSVTEYAPQRPRTWHNRARAVVHNAADPLWGAARCQVILDLVHDCVVDRATPVTDRERARGVPFDSKQWTLSPPYDAQTQPNLATVMRVALLPLPVITALAIYQPSAGPALDGKVVSGVRSMVRQAL